MKSIFFAINLALFFQLQAFEVDQSLREIPLEDRKKIEELFDYFGRLGNLGHVVFFNHKPMCLTGIPLSCTRSVTPPFILKEQDALIYQDRIKESWFTWKQYANKFPHPKFIFSEELIEVAGGEYINLYIINKEVFVKFLKENKQVFMDTLGLRFDPDQFMDELVSGKEISDLLNQDKMLLGMLLGYGKESAKAFREKSTVLAQVSCKPKLDRKIGVAPVSFMTNNVDCVEVEWLASVYAEKLKEMATLFQENRFSIEVLKALCSR